MVDKSLLNVYLLGLSSMLIFTAFQTMGNIQKTILTSIKVEDPSFDGRAYYSLAIYYAVFSVFNWTAPSVISVIGPKFSMVIGSATYLLFTLSFLFPKGWLMYSCSAVLGFGGAMFWTAQGNYLILNSTKRDISRNSGIFWAMLQSSMLIGNTFVYFSFKGQQHINVTIRTVVIGALSSILLVGIGVLLLLPKATKEKEEDDEEEHVEEKPKGPWQAFVGATKLFFTRNMLLLGWTFLYTGLEMGFYLGVYSSCIGFTRELFDRKKLVGVSGIFMGIGEVFGGTAFGIFGNKINKRGLSPAIVAGFVIHASCFILIFLNLPHNSPFYETDEPSVCIRPSNSILAIFCSFLLGLGDSLYNTQLYSLLGTVYADRSARATAIWMFTMTLGAAISFVYAAFLGLFWQLGILLITVTIGTITFIIVELRSTKLKP